MEKLKTLVIVDFQYDFCDREGSLYVPGAEEALYNIITLLNSNTVGQVIFTADWHPLQHCSFKENGGDWPIHCLEYTKGAAINNKLIQLCINFKIPFTVITKGSNKDKEEFGIKLVNDIFTYEVYYVTSKASKLAEIYYKNNVIVCGLAGDYCVLNTLKNIKEINPKVFLPGIASIDGGKAINDYINENNIEQYDLGYTHNSILNGKCH